MKKILLAGWCLLMASLSFAQNNTLPQKLRHLYQPLDKKQLVTGYLWDQAVCFASPIDYQGIQDTQPADINIFGMFYGALRNSYTQQENGLPTPSVYLQKIQNHDVSAPVPLSIMTMCFDGIRPDALSADLLTYDGQQLHDVPNRINSPYLQDTIFVIAPLWEEVQGLQQVFTLPDELWFSNLGAKPPLISMDAGDGMGWHQMALGDSIQIEYASFGVKTLRIRLEYSGFTRYASTKLDISASELGERGGGGMLWPRDLYQTIPVTSSKTYLGVAGQATMHIFYNTSNCNPAKRMLRPLIVIEGYEEPGVVASTYERMFQLLNKPVLNSNTENLTDYLYPAEYDLIYVDLANGSDYIQRNAFVIEEVIKKVNEMKETAGSTEQNVVIGVSMGGVVGKYALVDMKTNGPAHDTRLFITYDSPLRGANIPIGTQCLIKFMVENIEDYTGNDIAIPSLDLVWQAIQAPTPRQLLLYHVNAQSLYLGTNDEPINPDQIGFLAELDALGELDMRHVALSNGSGIGTLIENNIVADMPFFRTGGYKVSCKEWPVGSGVYHCGDVSYNLTVRATGNNTDTFVFVGYLAKTIPVPTLSISESWSPEVFTRPLDVSPGGTSNLGVGPLGNAPGGLLQAFSSAGVVITDATGLTATHHCFIPAFSSVSASLPTSFTAPQECSGTVERCTQSSLSTNISPYSMLPEINQQHVDLDLRIADVLVDELNTLAPVLPVRHLFLNPVLNTYYNIGTHRYAPIPTLNISTSHGKLSINNAGRIAFATPQDPIASFPLLQVFPLHSNRHPSAAHGVFFNTARKRTAACRTFLRVAKWSV